MVWLCLVFCFRCSFVACVCWCMQAKERRTVAEVLPFLCQLYPDDECLQLVCTLAVVRNNFADFRDKMERERTFSRNYITRLAALERCYVDAIRDFHDGLSPRMQKLFGSPLFPKAIYSSIRLSTAERSRSLAAYLSSTQVCLCFLSLLHRCYCVKTRLTTYNVVLT